MIVVDASAVVDAITGSDERARLIRHRIRGEDELAAPHLVDLEFAQALRRLVRLGEVTLERGESSFQDLADLALTRFPHEPFTERIWELRDRLSTYDAVYLALAEAIGVPLVTCDAGLAAVAERTADVELFAPETGD